MNGVGSVDRTTKYVTAVLDIVRSTGHATNAEIWTTLRRTYPAVSATTVHRVTARLLDHGALTLGPVARDGSMRFDANVVTHDHFMCERCGLLKDAVLAPVLGPLIEREIGDGCQISGSLTVSGICKACHKEDA